MLYLNVGINSKIWVWIELKQGDPKVQEVVLCREPEGRDSVLVQRVGVDIEWIFQKNFHTPKTKLTAMDFYLLFANSRSKFICKLKPSIIMKKA